MMIKSFRYIFVLCIFICLYVSCKSPDSSLNIVDGSFVKEELYPTVIKVRASDAWCSGIIVSKNVVLTAAHCFFNEQNGSQRNVHIEINGKKMEAIDYVWLDEYKNLNDKLVAKTPGIVSKIVGYDLLAMIFDDKEGKPPFEDIIEKARVDGTYFQLSSNKFKNSTRIFNNKKDIFFLGFGLKGESNQIKGSVLDRKNFSELEKSFKKQIGYSSFIYDSTKNRWSIPLSHDSWDVSKRPSCDMMDVLMSDDCIKTLEENFSESYSYPAPGDSGGPLIYKNQVLGVASRWGDIIKGIYTSVTFGSQDKVAEKFIKKLKDRLVEKNLLKNNLTISMLLNTANLEE